MSTPPLDAPVRHQGAPIADLFAATTGTDGDCVVKLIDVYPPTRSRARPEMGGYELPHRHGHLPRPLSRELRASDGDPGGHAAALPLRAAGREHVFLPGHRIMVQIQSTLFPLYDRNPQTFVPNIFDAKPSDYRRRPSRCCAAASRRARCGCRW